MNKIKQKILGAQAAFVVGLLGFATDAHAQFAPTTTFDDPTFSTIARNITQSVEEIPGLMASVAYMLGLLMGVMGVIKIKDHVENPTQTPMKDGAVRLAAGGALFALPMVFEAMLNTIGTTSTAIAPAKLAPATFELTN
ncbi:MAG: hypothetical protein KDI46_08570 [Alphaproteobacteria bacterium]|nr:hypothetical protein [Alphaproteobacteria bacterium]